MSTNAEVLVVGFRLFCLVCFVPAQKRHTFPEHAARAYVVACLSYALPSGMLVFAHTVHTHGTAGVNFNFKFHVHRNRPDGVPTYLAHLGMTGRPDVALLHSMNLSTK